VDTITVRAHSILNLVGVDTDNVFSVLFAAVVCPLLAALFWAIIMPASAKKKQSDRDR
jgi:hypothetical protein